MAIIYDYFPHNHIFLGRDPGWDPESRELRGVWDHPRGRQRQCALPQHAGRARLARELSPRYIYLSIYLSICLSIYRTYIYRSIDLSIRCFGDFHTHKKKKLTKSKLIYFFYSSCYPSVRRSLGIYSFLFHLNVRVRHQISQVRRQLCLYLGLFYLSICVSVFYLSI